MDLPVGHNHNPVILCFCRYEDLFLFSSPSQPYCGRKMDIVVISVSDKELNVVNLCIHFFFYRVNYCERTASANNYR